VDKSIWILCPIEGRINPVAGFDLPPVIGRRRRDDLTFYLLDG
jgi:hypothetical protein